MKKIISIIMACLVTGALFVGCGKYEPKLAETGVIYRSKLEKEPNGSYPLINIRSVTKDGDNIVVKTESPIEQMLYAYNNFIAFTAYDAKGNSTSQIDMNLKEEDQQGVFILTPKDMKVDEIKYIQIGPYQNEDDSDQFIEFEVK